MPSKKQYNLVHNDEYDTRIPLHSEEAFHRGIVFHAKFIGSMDVPRPTSRVEIVAAMRRIRYEFKAKGIKKKKVTLEVSVDGLKVTLRKKKKKQQWIDENKAFQMHYPIYRIFYVSHDSHDLKIFSYIARDGSSNSFKCNVFKSSKKVTRTGLISASQSSGASKLTSRKKLHTDEPRAASRVTRRFATMLKSAAKIAANAAELPSPTGSAGNQSPGSPNDASSQAPPRPRKKLSFKEPEIFNYLRMRKPSFRSKPPVAATPPRTTVSFVENPLEEENGELDELESQAMRVVRTVGQAFEVCHKLSLNAAAEEREQDIEKERSRERGDDHLHRSDDYDDHDEMTNERQQQITRPRSPSPNVHKDISLLGDVDDPIREHTPTPAPCILRTHGSSASPIRQSPSGTAASDCGDLLLLGGGELTGLKHEIQLLRERLDQQGQQTRAAVAHARLLQDQLAAETAARVEAQTRTHQLLVQNKELLEHIGALVGHLREQERASNVHAAGQSQVSGAGVSSMTPQTPTIPDLSTLGQSQRTPGQSSPWELEPPSFTYCSYPPEALYPGHPGMDMHGLSSSTDQLHFQTQLLERLHNISPYQPQRSPYATPSPYAMPAPSFLLSPSSNKPSNINMQSSPGAMSLRVSQANSYASSPVMSHKNTTYGTTINESPDPAAFIKPLPCTGSQRNSLHASGKATGTLEAGGKPRDEQRQQQPQQQKRITLEPPPQGKRLNPVEKQDTASRSLASPARDSERNDTKEKSPNNLPTILRTSGPPPSRTTSARLPSRSDLMGQVQRTTWARHTTK